MSWRLSLQLSGILKVTTAEIVLVKSKNAWQKRTAPDCALPLPARKRKRDPAPA